VTDATSTRSAERLCGTLLPGVLAFFGLQLLTVFSSAFQDGLDRTEQRVHLVAIVFVALAIAALLTPAAYLWRVDSSGTSPEIVHVTRRSLVAAMLALAIAIPIEVFLAACVILRGPLAIALGIGALALFFALWFVIPWARR
jgi:hypothetical protein